MSESVWFEQVDTALIAFIQSHVSFNGTPCKTKIRKPDEDFNTEDYPLISVYNLYDRFSKERYNPEGVVVSRDGNSHSLVVEDSALPYDLFYQIDFWATQQADMNSMTKQWKSATRRFFNLSVLDESGTSRSCFVLSRNDFNKSDLLQSGKRVFHSFGTYRVYTEIDENTRSTVPMVTETPNVDVHNKEDGD